MNDYRWKLKFGTICLFKCNFFSQVFGSYGLGQLVLLLIAAVRILIQSEERKRAIFKLATKGPFAEVCPGYGQFGPPRDNPNGLIALRPSIAPYVDEYEGGYLEVWLYERRETCF